MDVEFFSWVVETKVFKIHCQIVSEQCTVIHLKLTIITELPSEKLIRLR